MWRGISLANKCLLGFGGAIVIVVVGAMVFPWVRMNALVRAGQLDLTRQAATAWIELDRLSPLPPEGASAYRELAEETGMTPSAASQQLRVLRHLRFVAARRDGRSILYRLHDGHVAVLLAEARNHLEHATRGWAEP